MKSLSVLFALVFIFCSCSKEPKNEILPGIDEPSASENESVSETEEDVPIVNGWTPDFKPSDFESYGEYEKAFLDEYVKHLVPSEYFYTEKEYPSVIPEIFDMILEKETDEFLKCDELLGIEVFGDENEFFVSYQYITKEGAEEYLNIRVRKIEEGKYGLLNRGGGVPGGHGLEKADIVLEDIV